MKCMVSYETKNENIGTLRCTQTHNNGEEDTYAQKKKEMKATTLNFYLHIPPQVVLEFISFHLRIFVV